MAFGDIIQRAEGNNGSGTTTAQATFPSALTPGNLLVAIHLTGASGSNGVSNGTNSYTLGQACPNATEADWVGLYWRIAGSSEPQTVTATSSASDENAIQLIEIEGPWEASPVDIAFDQGRQASGTSYAIGPSGNTAQADEVAVAFAYTRNQNNDNGTASWSDSFVRDTSLSDESPSFKSVHNATKLLTAIGTVSTTLTVGASTVIQGGLVTFKKQAAGGDVSVNATTDALTLAEQAATVSLDVGVSASTDSLTLTEHAASVALGVNVSATTDALTLAEQAASISYDVGISANTDSLTLAEYAATVDIVGVISAAQHTGFIVNVGKLMSR